MWLKKIRKKKLQCFLIGLLLFLSALIFTTSLSMMTSISGYVNKFYSNKKFYDIMLYHPDKSSVNDIEDWCKNNPKVKGTKVIEGYALGNNIYHKGKNLKLSMCDVIPIGNYKNVPYVINKIKSLDNGIGPKKDSIWITQIMADNYNIKLGDKLTIKTNLGSVSLKVTSLINDSLQPSSTISQIYIYVNKNSLPKINSLDKKILMFIDAKSGVSLSKMEKDLYADVKNIYGYVLDKDLFILSATMTSYIMGGFSSLASVLVFIVSVFLIRFILWNNILKEYKSIGIYKALGFSRREMHGFYIIGYALTTFAGCLIGAICSIPILDLVATKVLKYIGSFNGVKINFIAILSTVILFTLVVIINLYLVIRKTNKISPVEALRIGVTSSRKKLTKSLIKNSTSPLALAINDMFKYKKVTSFITLTLTLALSLVLLFGNLNVTISKMNEHTNAWFGVPKSDVTISSAVNIPSDDLEKVLAFIREDGRVKNYIYGNMFSNGIVTLDTEKYKIKSNTYEIMVMNSYSKKQGFTITEGHNPKNPKEVAVSLNILKESGLSVGDYIELSVNNKKAEYLISGSYNSMMSNGYSIRLLSADIKKVLPRFVYSEIYVNLKSGVDKKEFKKYINNKYSNLDASDIHPMLKYTIESIPGTLLPISYLLMVVFIAFSSITILNIIIMNIRDNRRNFGIMKSLGFTSKEITLRYLYRILISTIFSIILAIAFNLTAARPIITFVINKIDVLIISHITMVSLLVVMTALIIIIILACCTAIRKTKPTELIEE